MLKKGLLWLLLLFVISGSSVFMYCKSKKTQTDVVVERTYLLTDLLLYSNDAIDDALSEATETHQIRSKKVFLQALDKFRNKKQIKASITLFRKSLTIYPNAIGYYELGNALLAAGLYEEAKKSYNAADHLSYDPYYMTTYKQACIFAKTGDVENALMTLESAIDEGYSDKEEFMTDPMLESLRNTDDYKILLTNGFEEDKEKRMLANFEIFLKNFPEVSLPYQISEMEAANFNSENAISYHYTDYIDGMEDGRFSRDVTNEYSYIANVYRTDKFTALLYSSLEAMADTLAPVTTLLVTYDSLGRPVDKLVFACQCSPEQIRAGIFNEDKIIQVKEFKRKWQFDPRAKGYRGNSIKGYEMVSMVTYTFTEDGHISEASPSNMQPVEVAESGFLW